MRKWWLLVAFALLVGVAFGYSTAPLFETAQQQETYPKYAEATHQVTHGGKVLAVNPKTEGVRYKTPCQQPQSRDESDLCAQWRAANAAEQGIRDATSQVLA